jgi:photosystem II stability/assembly factor-like uncharacterized protein
MRGNRNRLGTAALVVAICALPAVAEEHWEIQYHYHQADSTLTINDLTFPDETHGIACGFTTDRKDKDHPLVLLTSDGGVNWTEIPVKEACLSLFFLADSAGWMVTDTGIWSSDEAGRTWVKSKSAPLNLLRVWFLDHQRGFAAGREKRVYETKDGGATWTLLAIASTAHGDPVYTTFGDISFSGKKGLISGWNIPPRRGGPDWMEPSQAESAKQVPHLSILLQTKTGGDTWTLSETSLFGQITRISLSPQNVGLGLVEFKDQFDYPSEVYRIDLSNGKNEVTFRAKDRAITDVHLFPGSSRGLVAGYETNGPVYRSPIPGKLRVLTSDDLQNWTEMPVDYRAVAHAALITGPDDKHVWIGTDTGMILKLVQ